MENHLFNTFAIDFLTVPTAIFKVLYVFVIMSHKTREVMHFNVTGNPTARWTAQQIIEACSWDTLPKYLLRDRDGIYGKCFQSRIKNMGILEVKTAPRSPWQNAYVERLIGSIRAKWGQVYNCMLCKLWCFVLSRYFLTETASPGRIPSWQIKKIL